MARYLLRTLKGTAATKAALACLLAGTIAICGAPATAGAQAPGAISAKRINDAIAGGWLGQAVAGSWGYPPEFDFNGRIVPRKFMGRFRRGFTNRYLFGGGLRNAADELYVETPLIEALRRYGLNPTWAQLGEPFAATRFLLFGANKSARNNLRAGILPPNSGAPAFNPHSIDIDFQIESDFVGMAAPGQPGAAAELAWRLGHVMNYGDGVYGGVMVSAMHAAAFQTKNIEAIVAAGQAAVPVGTEYRRMIDEVVAQYQSNPRSWRAAWRMLEERWNRPSHHHPGELPGFNIDATLNGGYILLGLLFGKGKFERTIQIAIRAGQDSDCNANNAASIVGTMLGFKRIPKQFKGIKMNRRLAGTDYTLARVIKVNRQLAEQVTIERGGAVGRTWQIPADTLQPPGFEQLVPGDPAPTINATNVEVNGRTARFTVDAGAGLRDAWWSFGDLTGAHGQDVTHTYLRPGTYRVNLWVSSAAGTTSHRELAVAIP